MMLFDHLGRVVGGGLSASAHGTIAEDAPKIARSLRRVDKHLTKQTSRIGRTSELSQEITPEAVATAITSAASGNLGRLQGLYMRMTASDARYSGFVKALQAGLLSNPLRVFPSKTKTPASREYAQIASDILFMFKHSELVRRLAKPYLTGIVAYEPLWTISKGFDGKDRVLPYDLTIVPPTLYKMDMESDSETYGELMIVTEDDRDGVPVSEYPWGRLIVATDGTERGWYDLAGASRPCLFWFLVKTRNAGWWAEFNEIYGEPQRVAYFDESATAEELDTLRSYLQAVGRAQYAMFPQGVELELLNPDSTGTIKTYEDLITLANTEMAIAVLGQTQTSDGGEYGSYAKANVHMTVQYQIIKAIALMIKETLDALILSTIAFNVGPNFDVADLPEIRLVVPNPEEKEVKARVFKLAQEIGLSLPAQHVQDELGIPEPDEDDEILESQADKFQQNLGIDGEGPPGETKEAETGRDYTKEDRSRSAQRDETRPPKK